MLTLCGFSVSNYYNKVKLVLLEKGIDFKGGVALEIVMPRPVPTERDHTWPLLTQPPDTLSAPLNVGIVLAQPP